MKTPSKRDYERAERIVRKYHDEMYRRKQEAEAKKCQRYVGRFFVIENETNLDNRWTEYIAVVGIKDGQFELIRVAPVSSLNVSGQTIERMTWTLGMRDYFHKENEISAEEFADAFWDALDVITEKIEVK